MFDEHLILAELVAYLHFPALLITASIAVLFVFHVLALSLQIPLLFMIRIQFCRAILAECRRRQQLLVLVNIGCVAA